MKNYSQFVRAISNGAGGIRKKTQTEGGRAPCGSAVVGCFREVAKELGFRKLR